MRDVAAEKHLERIGSDDSTYAGLPEPTGMNPHLLDYLACPDCRGALRISDEDVSPVIDGTLNCEDCDRTYRILRGVPILLTNISDDEKFTADSFGEQWELFHRFGGLGVEFEENECATYWHPISIEQSQDQQVLEAGCGYGRNLIQATKRGAKVAIGFDVSPAVFIAKAKGVDSVMGDILNPPFRRQFDIVFSFGVMQHVSDARLGFDKLHEVLKTDGLFLHSVYSAEGNEFLAKFFTPLRVHFFRHLNRGTKYAIAWMLGIVSYLFFYVLYVPFTLSARLDAWARNHLFYYSFMRLFLRNMGMKVWICQIFDHLNAPVCNYLDRPTLEQWMNELKIRDQHFFFRNRNTWNFGGKKT